MAPGVVVTTSARSGPSTPLAASSGQFFVAGITERGPIDQAVRIRGIADFEANFGRRVTYSSLYDVVKSFFEEGGRQAYVARVVGSAATVGTATISDRAGTPVATLKIDAVSPGAWSDDISVVVADGTNPATVRVSVRVGQSTVETWNNLANPAAVVAALSKSAYVRATNMGSATAAPNNNPANGTFSLSVGDDDRASIDEDDRRSALARFVPGYGSGAVAFPGVGTLVHTALIEHAQENSRIALLAHDVDASIADLTSTASSIDSDAAGLFAPWIKVADNAGGVRSIPPEGYVAGARARAHDEVGPWRVPAGRIASSAALAGVEVEYTKEEADALDVAKVSIIRRINNTVRLYGWRSLSDDTENFGYLNGRDLLNYLKVQAEEALEDFVFAPVDAKGQLLATIKGELTGLVEPIRQAGGLYERIDENGDPIDPGYLVETGPEVNSTASLAQNVIRARLSIRVSPTGALVELTIVKVGILSGL